MRRIFTSILMLFALSSIAQEYQNQGKFEQLDNMLRSPNVYRTASGAPGHMYWQQRADYNIDVTLDEKNNRITGSETITYTNNSPDGLSYLWVQLDQNMRAKDSESYSSSESSVPDKASEGQIDRMMGYPDYDGGHKIQKLVDAEGNPMNYIINQTMMRIDLDEPLKAGESISFSIDWYYNINDRARMGGRGGYDYFDEDGNTVYTITQWFPRMAVYSDFEGWHNKQFLGSGEFALPFGDYEVNITVPADHIVASTGELQNEDEVLTSTQLERWNKSKTADLPVLIVNKKEAEKAEKNKASGTKVWKYKAENVRDFAFGSSRKFIWDAMGVDIDGKTVMAMSYYPKEAWGLWDKYSTRVVAHTLEVYSRMSIPYPYPVAISVEAANGMEYPMICFNYGRPAPDGTYSARTKYGMIGVIIHEVGHNFFPMIVNSDERQWTWMDEGLNSFLQFVAEQEWEPNYPSRRGPAGNIVSYMKGDKSNIRPIMTNSENIIQFGNNAYGKPATALNILRETVMGRELFDKSFKTFSERWAFKHPTPDDFFRTMEDASAVDLDWFWRGWFYSTDHVDISIENVQWFKLDSKNPEVENKTKRERRDREAYHVTPDKNKKEGVVTVVEKHPELKDFYNEWDEYDVTSADKKAYKTFRASLNEKEKQLIDGGYNFYEVHFENKGGLVMPIIVEMTYKDGSTETKKLPAEIWRKYENKVTKVFVTQKEVVQFQVDPKRETADVDEENNYWPPRSLPNRFELYQLRQTTPRGQSPADNEMRRAQDN
ncbi:M1 family metallopeptidase [Marivirga sp. S37H4]|uniref:M1 family metallopeptidase n=1 Tax=Marivirga aurantiaca TaxID=2802615 RepID=A0A934WZE1_9BACT|nr:M1 family metallopeptidase [Marivirga aurantiaca]MBK6265819.1 M1 family metallopeptidase [Marivirga aurantiaca]